MSITHRVKRTLVAGVAGAMVLSLMPAGIAAADEHGDVCDGAEEYAPEFADAMSIAEVHEGNVTCMAAYGITIGVDDVPNFAPGDSVTRQQMASFIARLAAQALNATTTIPTESPAAFPDVTADNTHYDAVNWIAELGITEGFIDGNYGPGEPVTRQQMASFIARAHEALGVDFDAIESVETPTEYTDVATISDVHLDNVLLLTDVGVIRGFEDGFFRPGDPITRQQMSQFIVESIKILDSQGLWNGLFLGFVPDATYDFVVDVEPETADTPTTFTISTTTSVDDEDVSVEGLFVTYAVFGFTVDLEDGLVDGNVDVASAVDSGTLPTDADGRAEFVTELLPAGDHLLVVWVSQDEANVDPGQALGVDVQEISVSVAEVS